MRERGSGSLFRERYRDRKTGQLKVCRTWMMKLWVGGKPLKRSARTTSRAVASHQLEQWKAQIRQGTYVPDADQTRFDDLTTLLIDEYRANGRKSLGRAEVAVDHLKGFFAGWRAQAISTDRVLAYVRHRQQQQAANATINRELAALKRMFRLGERAGRIVRRPFIDLLQEHNARTGFFERAECDAVLAQLPDDLQPVFAVAYLTGWRVKSELLTRKWAHVDFSSGWLRLEPGETKNAEGRQFPLTPSLRAVLERQRARTVAIEKATRTIIPWLFHRSGLGDGLHGRRAVGPYSARLPPHGRPEPRARGRAPVDGHEDGRAQDGEHLPALRDRGRGHAQGGGREAPNAPRGPGARGPRHPARDGGPQEARQFEYRPSQPCAARTAGQVDTR
jgi:integrase